MNKILYKFGAEWCSNCFTLDKIMPAMPDGVRLLEVDVDESREMVQEFNIRSIPALVLLDVDTGQHTRLSGKMSVETIRDFINK